MVELVFFRQRTQKKMKTEQRLWWNEICSILHFFHKFHFCFIFISILSPVRAVKRIKLAFGSLAGVNFTSRETNGGALKVEEKENEVIPFQVTQL